MTPDAPSDLPFAGAASTGPAPKWQSLEIIVVGPVQSGRTSVGRELAARLDAEFAEQETSFVDLAGCSFTEAMDQLSDEAYEQLLVESALALLFAPNAPTGRPRVVTLLPSAATHPKVQSAITVRQGRGDSAKALPDTPLPGNLRGAKLVELSASARTLYQRTGMNAPRPPGLVGALETGPYAMLRHFVDQFHADCAALDPLGVDTSQRSPQESAEIILAGLALE